MSIGPTVPPLDSHYVSRTSSPAPAPTLPARARRALDDGRRFTLAGRHDDAATALKLAASLAPRMPQIWHALGAALAAAGRPAEGAEALRTARDLAPGDAKVQVALADAHFLAGAPSRALPEYLRAVELDPTLVNAWTNAGAIFREAGEPARALGTLHRALAIDPRHAKALNNSGLAFSDMGEYGSARDCFSLALESNPGYDAARWNRAILDLLRGDFVNGWAGHEYRNVQLARMGGTRTFPEPRWDGSRFDGKRLLVWPEQGLGDQLQFVRFLPRVKALGGTVVLACAAPLQGLFRACLPDADEIVVVDTPYDACDLQVPLMSLPFVLGLGADLDADRVPYLYAPGAPSEAIASALPARGGGAPLRAGVVWAGQPKHQNDRNRSLSLETLLPLFDVPGVEWYSVQKGDAAEAQLAPVNEALASRGVRAITPLGPSFGSFIDTAHALAALDVVITVDTGVAHLAGAMGVPVFVLLPHVPDWRWQVDRSDSPWYPRTRLFRQATARDWTPVVASVRDAVASLVASRLVGPA